jgi:hypothetical protein
VTNLDVTVLVVYAAQVFTERITDAIESELAVGSRPARGARDWTWWWPALADVAGHD